jgi:hypothetical protein
MLGLYSDKHYRWRSMEGVVVAVIKPKIFKEIQRKKNKETGRCGAGSRTAM